MGMQPVRMGDLLFSKACSGEEQNYTEAHTEKKRKQARRKCGAE